MNIIGNKKGTSVVEVLVVMVILFVGILIILQLFPPGFSSVRSAENMTIAGRLAQAEMERWKNNTANLPDGIIPIHDDSTAWDELFPGPQMNDDNATAFRRVIGETTRIPFGGWDPSSSDGSIYLLAFSPVVIAPPASPFAVRGGSLNRRIGDSSDAYFPFNLKPYQYGIDYTGPNGFPMVCFHPENYTRMFYMACSWWENATGSPKYHTTTTIAVSVAPNTSWIQLQPLSGGVPIPLANFGGFDQYSDTCSRGFIEIPKTSAWSTDPYEYKIIDAMMGIIAFNPLGYSRTEFGRNLEAHIDYDILDLQIIHEDRRIPPASVGTDSYINLALKHIKETSVSGEGNYHGLPIGGGTDVEAVDIETGYHVDGGLALRHKDGRVQIPSNLTLQRPDGTIITVPSVGRNVRFFYKAENDWSVQFLKAYSRYERADAAPLDYKSYYVDNSLPDTIWFAACNGNHTVSVDYEYDDSGAVKKVVGEAYQVSDTPAIQPFSGGIEWVSVQLKHIPTRIYSVNGISAKARVLWRERDRWRRVDLDSTMVRTDPE